MGNSMSTSKVVIFLLSLCWLNGSIHAQSSSPSSTPNDVHIKLSLADNKTTFRIGEPIKLVMEFTADAPGYTVDTIEDRKQPTADSISISPDSGLTRWLDEMNRGLRYSRDEFTSQALSNTPTRVGLSLNDTLRFDRPGHYTVKLSTRRVSKATDSERQLQITLKANEVSFDVRPISEEDEQKEVKRVSALLDTRRDLQTDENVTQELSYLTGDASTREKVRRFLNPEDRNGNYGSHIWYGLYIAKNRELVLQLLERALRDTNQPVNSSLLRAAISIRFLKENTNSLSEPKSANGTLRPEIDPRIAEIQNTYLSELAAGLNKRTGKSLTTTAMTILTTAKKDEANRSTTTSEARRVLVQNFVGLHPFDQDYLLGQFWDDLRDPSLVAPLKQMLSYHGVANKNIHDSALQRLIELAPEEARPYVVTEICDTTSLVNAEILGKLSNKSLPEVDACLLEQFKRLTSAANNRNRIYLEHKAVLAVRYATENIYQDLMQLYREASPKLALEVRAALLAYLAKQNEPEAIPLIEQTLAGIQPGEDFNFLPMLTKLYYSEAFSEVLKKRLGSDEPQAASNAAYLLGVHGVAGDELVLQARLERWQKDWRERVIEADANLQGMVERELIYALLNGKAWKLSAERRKELQESCVTKMCKQSIRAR
jgi:hypothetical protein